MPIYRFEFGDAVSGNIGIEFEVDATSEEEACSKLQTIYPAGSIARWIEEVAGGFSKYVTFKAPTFDATMLRHNPPTYRRAEGPFLTCIPVMDHEEGTEIVEWLAFEPFSGHATSIPEELREKFLGDLPGIDSWAVAELMPGFRDVLAVWLTHVYETAMPVLFPEIWEMRQAADAACEPATTIFPDSEGNVRIYERRLTGEYVRIDEETETPEKFANYEALMAAVRQRGDRAE
jgi:hypothetical protein